MRLPAGLALPAPVSCRLDVWPGHPHTPPGPHHHLVRLSLPEPLLLPGPAGSHHGGGQGGEGGARQGESDLGEGGQLQVCRLLPNRILRATRPQRHRQDVRQDQQEQKEYRLGNLPLL